MVFFLERAPVEVAASLSYQTVYHSFRYARSTTVPPIPQTIEEYGEALEAYRKRFGNIDGVQRFYEATVNGEDGGKSVVFVCNPLADMLSTSPELHMDATFQTRPSHPKSYQLFSIMAMENDHVSN